MRMFTTEIDSLRTINFVNFAQPSHARRFFTVVPRSISKRGYIFVLQTKSRNKGLHFPLIADHTTCSKMAAIL